MARQRARRLRVHSLSMPADKMFVRMPRSDLCICQLLLQTADCSYSQYSQPSSNRASDLQSPFVNRRTPYLERQASREWCMPAGLVQGVLQELTRTAGSQRQQAAKVMLDSLLSAVSSKCTKDEEDSQLRQAHQTAVQVRSFLALSC